MFSRGKILVKLALNKQADNLSKTNESTLDGRNFTIQGKEIEERPSTSSIQDQ
jgi:hypothetical protein